MSHLYEHIFGSLVGQASGDAFGMPTEFLTREEIWNHYGWVDNFTEPYAGHFHVGMPAGRITDDTGQTLAILKEIISNDGLLTPMVVGTALIKWKNEIGDEFDKVVGPSTRNAIRRLEAGEDPKNTGLDGRTNGAAMRSSVAGLLYPSDIHAAINAAHLLSAPTHGTNIAIAGACAVAGAVSRAMDPNSSVESIIDAAQLGAKLGSNLGHKVWGTSLEKRIILALEIAEKTGDINSILEDLYNMVGVDLIVAESVAVAIAIVKLACGDPVKAAIYSANIGGDTDTIGAISGAICGAWKGISVFPTSWLIHLEMVNHIGLPMLAKQTTLLVEKSNPYHF